MGEVVLQAENISKQYRLGLVGTGSMTHDLNRWWHRVRGKEDPYLTIGEENDRSKAGNSDYVWALKDINFEVKEGEVLGIIGKNGAGKSTLLKILSRVTGPTTGEVRVRGRIASLLEVGTGFHPELTGRENIFQNGAILGMNKAEIRSKLDEIIAFSGVERYVDTPVKRYSSGMYVRLAFAVAAHLEPEILIVDEVLAVGDAEFQRKCLGKMKEVSGNGRTVLFVSHQMGAVKQLCNKAMFMEHGKIKMVDETDVIVNHYLSGGIQISDFGEIPEDYPRTQYHKNHATWKRLDLENTRGQNAHSFMYREPIKVKGTIKVEKTIEQGLIVISFGDQFYDKVTYSGSNDQNVREHLHLKPGTHEFEMNIHQQLLPGQYNLSLNLMDREGYPYESLQNFGSVVIENFAQDNNNYPWSRRIGITNATSEFKLNTNGIEG